MPKTVTISGVQFELSTPYEEGHQITAAEAKALNQMRAENIGNNFRSKIKEASEKGDNAELDKLKASIAEADKSYQFTLASAGGGRSSMSPEEREAKSLATAYVNSKIKEKGQTVKAYKEANADKYAELVAQVMENDKIKKQAAENVKRAQEAAKGTKLDLAL